MKHSETRSEIISSIQSSNPFDVVVVGGGIHGAACARFAASSGLQTVLFEKGDYAEATSSRSSKMAHGGLRYLEMLDFQQVFEGIKARETLFDVAPHLVKPERFLIPVLRGHWFFKIKLGIGLVLYDLMVKARIRRHRWISRKNLNFEGFNSDRQDLEGCYMYTDGLMNDSRLVIENVRAAREKGARCLNYASVESVTFDDNSQLWKVVVRDNAQQFTVHARTILNCGGPWVADLAGSNLKENVQLRFSRGTHIIFSKKWNSPSLFLPMEGKARYYFVWPHAAGTMVGTTEREVESAERDPFPTSDEISEIYARLAKDLPHSGLNEGNAHYCFAGVRTLPLRGSKKGTTTLSRKHKWNEDRGMFSLIGGKYTTASWTAAEGVNLALQRLGRPQLSKSISNEPLPGALSNDDALRLIADLKTQGGFSEEAATRLVGRLGARAREVLEYRNGKRELGSALTEGEVRFAIECEQAEKLEDLMRRRVDVEYHAGHGFGALDEICRIFKELRPDFDVEGEKFRYQSRLKEISHLLKAP